MKVALITTAPKFIEGLRLEEEAKALGYDFTTVNVGHSSYILEKGKLVLIAETCKNLKQGNFKKEIIDLKQYDTILMQRMFKCIKEISPIIKDARKNGVRVFDNNLTKHNYVINKVVDEVKLGVAGILTPKTIHSRDFESLPILAEKIGYPIIFKNTNKGKGVGVYKFDSKDQLTTKIKELESLGKKASGFLIQQLINYKHDLRVLVVGDSIFTMERIPKQGEFRANFSLGGSVKPFSLNEEIKQFAIKAIRAVGLNIAGVDVLIDDQGTNYILEVNHTPGFVGMEKALGENIGKKIIQFSVENAY